VRRALLIGALATLCSAGPVAQGGTTYTCVGADGRRSFSDRPCPASSADSARRDAGAEGYAAPRHGATFGVERLPDGAADARCDAGPTPQDRPLQGACDVQRGDTVCTRALPVLCLKPGRSGARPAAVVDPATGRISWSRDDNGPQLGATPALRGDTLVSQQSGTQACAAALGAEWRMAAVDDAPQWTPQVRRHSSLDAPTGRLWVAAAASTQGNCWSISPDAAARAPSPRTGRSASERAGPLAEEAPRSLAGQLARLRSSPEFARLSAPCRERFDTLERGWRRDGDGAAPSEAALMPALEWLQSCGQELGR
jgi:Domain of unknown function (DUF4124)